MDTDECGGEQDVIQLVVVPFVRENFNRLLNIWNEIGIFGEDRQTRVNTVLDHMNSLLVNMVNEEEHFAGDLKESIAKCGQQIITLCDELSLDTFEPGEGHSQLMLELVLRTKVDDLSREKYRRLKSLKALKDEERNLCEILGEVSYFIPKIPVPTLTHLQNLSDYMDKLRSDRITRHNMFLTLRNDIVELLAATETVPETSLAKEIVEADPDATISLSTVCLDGVKEILSQLENKQAEQQERAKCLKDCIKSLYTRLEVPTEEQEHFLSSNPGCKLSTIMKLEEEKRRLDRLKLINLESFILSTKEDLLIWWEKCHLCAEEKEECFPAFSDEISEDVLEGIENELKRVKCYYEDNKELLLKVSQWDALWSQHLQYEAKACDPSRLFNRGGGLLKEQKMRNKIHKDLPKLETKIAGSIKEFEDKESRRFLVNGIPFLDYVHDLKQEEMDRKESEKLERQQAKAKNLQHDIKLGTKPAIPNTSVVRGRPFTTPTKTMTPRKRFNPGQSTMATPGSVGKCSYLQHSSLKHTSGRLGVQSGAGVTKSKAKRKSLHRKRRSIKRVLQPRINNSVVDESMMDGIVKSSLPNSLEEFSKGLRETVVKDFNSTMRSDCSKNSRRQRRI